MAGGIDGNQQGVVEHRGGPQTGRVRRATEGTPPEEVAGAFRNLAEKAHLLAGSTRRALCPPHSPKSPGIAGPHLETRDCVSPCLSSHHMQAARQQHSIPATAGALALPPLDSILLLTSLLFICADPAWRAVPGPTSS